MSQKLEQISALVDNEINDSELKNVKKLFSNENEAHFYLRQKMVSQILKGKQVTKLPFNFNQKITDSIAKEPTIFSPNNLKKEAMNIKQKIVGLSIAASVAIVSFVMLQNNETQISVPQFQQAQVVGVDGISRPASISIIAEDGYQLASDIQIIPPEHWSGLDQKNYNAYTSMVNQYLAAHTEVSSVSKIQGVTPYSKIVGYDSQIE